jgi:D-arginine dehydrogenase
LRLLPLLRPGYAQAGLYDAAAADMDVDALHQHYLRRFRAAGGMLVTRARVETLERAGGVWQAGSAAGRFAAPVVVNAAGAWADHVAGLAGVRPVGLVPRRRTAALIAQPAGVDARGWPMGADVGEAFYLKPDAGMLLISPADETPSPPCDAQPEEIDLALCVARIEAAFAVSVQRLARRWAGLRSFVADRTPVAGYAADAPGFFWLAGQGGYGIQTAPALARVAAALAMGRALPEDIAAEGVRAAALAPGRAALV